MQSRAQWPMAGNLTYLPPDGDDAGAGTLADPFRTLAQGVAALARLPGGSLAMRGGLYREAVDMSVLKGTSVAPFHIHRYGTEPVTISAAEVLGGWTPVTETEALALGADPQGLYKAIVPKSTLSHGTALALNLHEAGDWSPPATDRADLRDPATYGRPDTYHSARFATDADDLVLALRDARLIGRTEAEMREVRVLLYHRPNLVSIVEIAQFDATTGTILLADQSHRMQRRGGDPVMLYGLLNTGWQLGAGQWIAREDGGDISVYLRPKDPEALQSGIEISVRGHCIDLQGAQHLHLTGLNAIRAAGTTRQTGVCIRKFDRGEAAQGLRLTHCRAGENVSAGGRGYGAIFLRAAEGLRLSHVTVAQTHNSFGLAVFHSRGADMRELHLHHVAQSPARFYGLRDSVLAFSLFEDSATDSHANKFNFYEGSDNVLVYGLRARRVGTAAPVPGRADRMTAAPPWRGSRHTTGTFALTLIRPILHRPIHWSLAPAAPRSNTPCTIRSCMEVDSSISIATALIRLAKYARTTATPASRSGSPPATAGKWVRPNRACALA